MSRFQTDECSLDKLLEKSNIPKDFEVLSIDIDSYDLHVWESLQNFSPKIVIIEIDSRIPPGLLLRYGGGSFGNSFSATTKLGREKGYTLVIHTGNLIFVRDDLVQHLMIPNEHINSPELLFNNEFMSINFFSPPTQATIGSLLISVFPKSIQLFIMSFLKVLRQK